MASNVLRVISRHRAVPIRAFTSSSVSRQSLTAEQRDEIHPRLGNRDIVGFGYNGSANYMDRLELPCPAIRFKESTPDVLSLREKEKGDWKNLSAEEKKALYRSSFCQTFSEMRAPTGEWKSILAAVIGCIAITGWTYLFMKKFVYPPMPHTITKEWQEANVQRMIQQRTGAIEGVASNWDYEKGQWK